MPTCACSAAPRGWWRAWRRCRARRRSATDSCLRWRSCGGTGSSSGTVGKVRALGAQQKGWAAGSSGGRLCVLVPQREIVRLLVMALLQRNWEGRCCLPQPGLSVEQNRLAASTVCRADCARMYMNLGPSGPHVPACHCMQRGSSMWTWRCLWRPAHARRWGSSRGHTGTSSRWVGG